MTTRRNRTYLNKPVATALSVGLVSAIALGAVCFIPNADAQMHLRGYASASLREANRQFEWGQWENAEQSLQGLLKKNPGNTQARAALSVIQAELYRSDAAEENAQKVLQKDPKNANAYITMALVRRNQTASSDMTYRNRRNELLEEAVSYLKTAINYDPNNPDAYNRLGEVYRLQGDSQNAMSAFEKATELDPKFSEAHANLGRSYFEQGNVSRSMDLYRKAITNNSKNYKAHMFLGEALSKQGQYHEALKEFNTALYQKRTSAMVYTKMGETLQAQGNEAAAINAYRKAIDIKPEYSEAYLKLADVFDQRGDGELSMAELRSGLNVSPKNIDLRLALGRTALTVSKPDQAIRYYEEVLQYDPHNAKALEGLSQALLITAQSASAESAVSGSDRLVDAEEAINKALMANPTDINLHLAKLRVERLSGKPKEAQASLETLVSQTPYGNESDVQKIARGEALIALGRYQESDALFNDMVTRYRGDVRKTLALADVLASNGDLDMAEKAYRTAQNQQPKNLKAQRGIERLSTQKESAQKEFRLANSLNSWMSSKKRQSAKDFYLETLQKYPRHAEARLALAELYEREDQYGKAAFEYETYLNLSPELTPEKRERLTHKVEKLKERALTAPASTRS